MSLRRNVVCGSLAAVVVSMGLGATSAHAHPLGNLTSNTSTTIVVEIDRVAIDYVVDLAELPTVQARQAMDVDDDGSVSAAEATAAGATSCAGHADGLTLSADGRIIGLEVVASMLTFPEGQAGLPTARFECRIEAPLDASAPRAFSFEDTNLVDRIGWREVIARGDGTTITGDVPSNSSSSSLTAYPTDVTPPRVLEATFRSDPGGASISDAPDATLTGAPSRGADGLTERFQRLVGSRELTVGLALFAVALAFVLGATHALAPGHGKTLMAAAVVSRRGTTRQILEIGATVTLTHTAGVLALGSLIWFSDALAPDDAVPWLTVASGALVAALGLTLLVRRVVLGQTGHGHHHVFGHQHGHEHHEHHEHHDDHDHSHDPAHEHEHEHEHHHAHHGHHGHHAPGHDHAAPALTRRWVVSMGIAGGLVPTPSALVVLLGATALGRTWLGVVLVGVYGIGMATTLLLAGLLLVRLQSWLERNWFDRAWLRLGMRLAPVVTASVLVLGGISIAVRGAVAV